MPAKTEPASQEDTIPFILQTHANSGLEGVLLSSYDAGEDRSLAFFSRELKPAETGDIYIYIYSHEKIVPADSDNILHIFKHICTCWERCLQWKLIKGS